MVDSTPPSVASELAPHHSFHSSIQISEAEQLLAQQQEQQYLEFLQETWITTQPECLENLTKMATIIERLVAGNCDYLDQQQAHQQVHKLVGTLGIFYLRSAMKVARQIERMLKKVDLLPVEEAMQLPVLMAELIHLVTTNTPQQHDAPQTEFQPVYQSALLLIDLEPTLNDAITVLSQPENCQVVALSSCQTTNPTDETIESYLTNIPATAIFLPTVVLMTITDEIKNTACLGLLQSIHQQFPHWSVLVLSTIDSLSQRLAVAQNGGKFLANYALTPEEIFRKSMSLGRSATDQVKVMIVDDDANWLRTLPQLLQDWELKVTTLADPLDFFMILQLVQPDIIILDIQMPNINGLEICQILRSDPHWQHLPIILLCGINNEETQRQAFKVGADDYLCKPIKIDELAQRIRHRFTRINSRKLA